MPRTTASFLAFLWTFFGWSLVGTSALLLPHGPRATSRTSTALLATNHNEESSRRSLLLGSLGACLATASVPSKALADVGSEVRGIKVTPFNGLMYQYRSGSGGDSGLSATDLNEPSVPYDEFVKRLGAGEVSFVEFLAPDGDAAYVTFKGDEGKSPIRIGEGYPIEQHDGWSSPAFAVRTVKNAGVPYKFVVPGLEKFKSG